MEDTNQTIETRTCVPSGKKPGGRVSVIPSKSVAHRVMIAQALSGQVPTIDEFSADITATKGCLAAIADFKSGSGKESYVLPCNESGSTLRFLLPVVAALGMPGDFQMNGRLPERPLTGLYEMLTEHGVSMSPQGSNPMKLRGQLQAGEYVLPGNISSQYVTGLLLALPLLKENSTIRIEGTLQSKPYVELTRSVMKQAGIVIMETNDGYLVPGGQRYAMPEKAFVEGDWSNAAFWLCLSAITGGEIHCTNLSLTSRQGDMGILDILNEFGADITVNGDDRAIVATAEGLKGITLDATDVPDLVPIVSLVAAVSEGVTHITGVERLRLKESDRLVAIQTVLNALGGQVEIRDNELWITGVKKLTGGTVDSFNDHRIAMMAAVASQVSEGPVTIERPYAVNKSYPGFYEIFDSLVY